MVNLFLFEKQGVDENGLCSITNLDKVKHIIKVLKSKKGDKLKAGIIDVGKGMAEILSLDNKKITLKLEITDNSPPSPSNLIMIVAIPRPQMITNILKSCATMGVVKKNFNNKKDRILFINSERTEKNYFQSTSTEEKAVRKELIRGAEQGGNKKKIYKLIFQK